MTVYAIAEKASAACQVFSYNVGLTILFRRLILSSLKVYQQRTNQGKIILVIYSPVSARSSLLPVLRDRQMGVLWCYYFNLYAL